LNRRKQSERSPDLFSLLASFPPVQKIYGTDLHQRGATLPDLGLRPTPRELLACLKPGELGSPEFTLEGWLQEIEHP